MPLYEKATGKQRIDAALVQASRKPVNRVGTVHPREEDSVRVGRKEKRPND